MGPHAWAQDLKSDKCNKCVFAVMFMYSASGSFRPWGNFGHHNLCFVLEVLLSFKYAKYAHRQVLFYPLTPWLEIRTKTEHRVVHVNLRILGFWKMADFWDS